MPIKAKTRENIYPFTIFPFPQNDIFAIKHFLFLEQPKN